MITIRNANKLMMIEAMGEPPVISGRMVAEHIGVHPVTVYRWMQNPNDEQTKRIMDAIKEIRNGNER